jgi:hypothetical protein
LKETARANQRPKNPKELFNLRHASLRNAIERIFGVVKRRFPILESGSEYSLQTQVGFVPALAALHNFIRLRSDDAEMVEWEATEDSGLEPTPAGEIAFAGREGEDGGASDLRDRIATAMWDDYLLYRQRNGLA